MIQESGANQRLSVLNQRPSILSGPDLLHELVRPLDHDATAIDFLEYGSKRRKFSYKDLHSLSDALAGSITERLAKLESASPVIPVFLPQSPELYIVLLAILKAGKAFCPLNLDTPTQRLKFILDDISADLLITSSILDERIRAAINIDVVSVDKELCDREAQPIIDLRRPNTKDLAYVLYTSGSTGKPKAVSTFDVSIFEIFFPWFRGRTLVSSTRAHMLDDLPGAINNLEVDAAELTPTVVSNLLQGRSSVPGLKLLLTIGEMLTQHVIDEYGGDETKESMLWAMYGPTEASIHCTLQPQFSTHSSTSIIGRPLDTVSAFIIAPMNEERPSADIEILSSGEVGELAIGGPQVAEEYLNRPDLTSASFIEHPEHGRLYRTGDRARINRHGVLECLGRVVAGQVKLRGQRVELGEIEQAIMRIQSCRTATVIIVEESLVAFCAADSSEVTRADVLATCNQWLPAFMIPSHVYFIDTMPQLPSGKIDKDSLAKTHLHKTNSTGLSTSTTISPGDHVSQSVLETVGRHISQDLGSDTDLSSAGLDSLRAIRIASALRRQGFVLGAMEVLSARTLSDLVAICRSSTQSANRHNPTHHSAKMTGTVEIPQLKRWKNDIASVIPCTPLQEAMLAETISRPTAYCNRIEVELSVTRTYEDIRNAMDYLASKSEILRTGFVAASQHAGTFSQIIWRALLPSQIQEVDVFSKSYSMSSDEDFLRPFHVQVMSISGRPRLLFRIHHALYDGWSFDLLLHDLDTRLHGEETVSRPQFRDVVQYFTQLRPEDQEVPKSYWSSLLNGYLPVALPNYHGKLVRDPATHHFSGRSAINRSRLLQRAQEMAVNPQVYFQAATAYILSLYSGTNDIVLGNVTSGRTIPIAGVEDVIGPCIATVPFRINLSKTLDIHDLLRTTQALNRECLSHSTLPFREIVKAGNIPPGTRLFDVLFVWQQSIISDSSSSLASRVIDSADDLEFRLTLEFEPREDNIFFHATYDASTIPEHQIKYLSRQIDEIVNLLLSNANHGIDAMKRCFTTPSLSIANPTPRQQTIEHGPAHAIEQWALKDPRRSALKFARVRRGVVEVEEVATYGLLNTRANQFARVLADHGVGDDQLVCIMMEKSIDLYICILAVLKLGCGYLPIVPDTPIDRVRSILDDAQVTVCVSDTTTATSVRNHLLVDIIEFNTPQLAKQFDQNLDVPYSGQHLAYAVFTSGSTGAPKGVLVTQDNLMSNLEYLSTIYPVHAGSCLLQSCSQAFDVSVFEIFFSWHVGICLCTATKDDLFHDFEAAINCLGVTHLSLTPTVAALVDPVNVPKVEFLVTAGEALTEHVRRMWAGKGLYQGYGPSETTNICTVRAAVTPDDLINNIGMPFDNTSALVLDPESEAILPLGAVGELCFGGYQVFRGYLNRPELNAAKIINHSTYGRIYRSGDTGILLPDGSILSKGRMDDQVKIRGQRVELGEITSVMLDHQAVQDCVTLLLPRSDDTQTLVVFWVPNGAASDSFQCLAPLEFESVISDLSDLLSRRLPSYMVPSHLVPVSRLPMTMQAKIDKALLQRTFWDLAEEEQVALQWTQDDAKAEVFSPWEKAVAQVLSSTLNTSPEGIQRTSLFFSLGLDSVSAIRFCNGLRKQNLGDFSISTVLKNASIARLASVYQLHSRPSTRETARHNTVSLDKFLSPEEVSRVLARYNQSESQVAKILPCTPLQEAMLSSGQPSSHSAYCNIMLFDVKGDVSRLQESWKSMLRRHEILRTCFVATENPSFAFTQVVLRNTDLKWHHYSTLDGLPPRINSVISENLAAESPPIHLALIQDGQSTKLLFGCHHALYDGIAISTLIQEVQDTYLGIKIPPPVSYDVYLQYMLQQDYAEGDKYWATLLSGFEPALFPSLTGKDSRAQGNPASSSKCLQLRLSTIRTACQDMSLSLLSVVHAAWAKLLHFYTGENDICFGNVVNGRNISSDDLDRIVAPCFNTLPVRIILDPQQTNDALMRLAHSISIESLAHQLTPLRRIQSTVLREGGRLFDSLVILQQPKTTLDSTIWTLEQDLGDMDLPIVCELVQDPVRNTLELSLHYQTSLLSEVEARLVMETFDTCISSLLAFPGMSSSDISPLPAHLRAESNMDYEQCQTDAVLLHSGFERIAATHPDRIALEYLLPDGSKTVWSFATLNEKANSVAHALIGQGVGPDDIVPIHMLKSPCFYASILGVIKAGAAFAPVYPGLPEARRRIMFQELKPKLVLCSDTSTLPDHLIEARIVNAEAIPSVPHHNPVIDGLVDTNLAYCLFTSGSTGVPKAVSMEHRAPVQTIASSDFRIPWNPSSRLLQYAAVTFDMCYYDCFLAWTHGFTLCATNQSDLLNDLPKVINSLQVNLLDLTPSVAVSLKRSDIPSVKWLYCIGEAMAHAIVKEWGDSCVNSYGPTEAAFCTTISPVSVNGRVSIIGKPFPSTSFAIFSARGKSILPVLSTGELYIGGAQLARGYLGNPDLTSERFVIWGGQRFYKSGDLARMLSDGSFEFVGRTDDQVKIRGLRVELGEINHVLQNAHPDVAFVTTQILKKQETDRDQLVAFLITHGKIEESELKTIASSQLPSYMVPQFFVFVDEIPRSMAGKIDKKALTNIFRDHIGTELLTNGFQHGSDHQWTQGEIEVRDVLARLSDASQKEISPTTSIYQLGLDSISAVQIAAALRKQGYSVSAADVLNHTTCADLAEFIGQAKASDASALPHINFSAFEGKHKVGVLSDHSIYDGDVVAVRPCTPLQKGMISQFLATEGAVYMNHIRMQLEVDTDLERLKKAWDMTRERHSTLRSGFAQIKDPLHAFAMIEYTPTSTNLPWSTTSSTTSDPIDEWLKGLQRAFLQDLHLPPWSLRIIQEEGHFALDLAMFHALFDAQSLQSILNDVTAAYEGRGLSSPTSIDTTISSIIQLSATSTEDGEAVWNEIGKAASPCRFPNLTPLRYDPSSPSVCTRQSTKPLHVLEDGCRNANITMQAAGIASWLSLLSSYTGESSVTCGVVLSGRTFDGAEDVVFPCINTVPVACTVSKDMAATLTNIMALNNQIQQYQFTPLNKIQRLMGFPNEALFDTIFAYQKLPSRTEPSRLWRVVEENAAIEYPISIELEPMEGYLEYRLTFLPHIVPKEQAALILEQLDHLMESYTSSTTAMEAHFSEQLYSITPAKDPELPSDVRLLHELVESTATKYPRRVAFEFVSANDQGSRTIEQWTYAELDAEGNRIAHLVTAHGVQPGSLVGVCFDKCPEASFAMLGILKAGCAYVAIDPGAPAARQAFIVEDSRAQAVLSLSSQADQFEGNVSVPVLKLDEIDWRSLPGSSLLRNDRISSQDRSYCLYTSGTTGTPKGCELTHENAVQALLAFQRLFTGHWDTESRWLQFASFHFDVSVLEQYWSWSVGICVVSAPRDLIFEDLAKTISDLNITHIDLTPSLAQILHPDDVPSLCKGVFITGGESLKQEILDVWGPKGVIYNGYGPTEATIGCTMFPRVPANGRPSNIGPQFDNVGSLVLHPGDEVPVLRGGVGELCVSGKLVGRGYLNRPELTAERFPHLERLGARVYRTGDLVRILHDGTFQFLGRADDQVKLRGQRLEVAEINSVIKQSSSAISDVATLVLKHPKQQKEQLVAFLVCGKLSRAQPQVQLGDVEAMGIAKEACHEKLPPYMIPTHFVPLSTMPLNINNKADAKKLKELYDALSSGDLQAISATSNEKDEVWSEHEKKLCQVLSQALGVSEQSISKDASFFEMGMDSISVIGISHTLKQSGFASATASVVMRCPTIRRLAKALEAGGPTDEAHGSILAAQQAIHAVQHRYKRSVAQSLSIESSVIDVVAPCTPLQQGMIARSLESENGLYFNTFRFKLDDSIDERRLDAAWNKVHASISILRTVFVNTEEGHVQVVLRAPAYTGMIHTPVKEQHLAKSLELLRQRWLGLNQPDFTRPFEIHLITTPTQKLLSVHIFHGLYDGNSIELIFRAVWDVYNDRDLQLHAPAFHTALAHGPLSIPNGAKEFWQNHLDKQTLHLPTISGEAVQEAVVITRTLPGLTGFDSVRRQLNVTAQAIAQACWLSVLCEHVKGAVTAGMVVSGRSIDLEGADRIIGPMFNTIPYQHCAQRGESWSSAIKRVHDFNVGAHPHQHTPLRKIMKWCKRTPSQPLFDNLFAYQIAQGGDGWAKNDAWEILDNDTVADYPLALEVEQRRGDVFKLTLVSQDHVAHECLANELLDRFEEALRQVLVDPSTIPAVTFEDGAMQNSILSANGKISNGDKTSDFEWTSDAIKIKEETAQLSGLEYSSINENTSIFELGLDSIDAIKLSSKLKKRGVTIPVSGIMRGLTIAKMVQLISPTETSAEATLQPNLDAYKRSMKRHLEQHAFNNTDVEEVLPLTPLQEAMVAEMIASDYTRYYNHDVLELDPNTDVKKLQEAWTTVVAASPILRTGFVEVDDPELDDSFVQVVHKQHHDFWTHIEVEGRPDFASIFRKLRHDSLQKSLSTPRFHLSFVETSGQCYLILSIAHALYDGWSLGLLHSDVQRAYDDEFTPRPSYEASLINIVTTSVSASTGFWQDYLSGAITSSFPRRTDISSETGSHVHRHERNSAVVLDELQTFARRRNVSLQTIGQTVFALVTSLYTNSLDVTFGSVLSGRDDEERSQLMFPTMNTIAIRSVLHGSGGDMLHYMQDNFTNIKQWQHYPLRKALSAAGVDGRLFESLFIYQKGFASEEEEGQRLYTSIEGHSDVEYPVCVEMEAMDKSLVWRCAVKEEVFDEEASKQLLDRMDDVLRHLMEHPETSVIEVTTNGTSVCGMPAFKQRQSRATSSHEVVDDEDARDPPSTETARKIRESLAFVSKTPEDEMTSGMTIFHMGLDSISAIKVSSLLRKQGIILGVGEMLRAGTIKQMASLVDSRTTQQLETSANPHEVVREALKDLDRSHILDRAHIDDASVAEILPVTAGQLYMLSMWLNNKGSNFYAEFTYAIYGGIGLNDLNNSWHALVATSPILRSSFVTTGDHQIPYVAVVLKDLESSVTDITGCTHDEIRQRVQTTTTMQPWAYLFASQTSSGWALKLKIHHALYDGVSLPLLMQKLQAICNGAEVDPPDNTLAQMVAKGYGTSELEKKKSFWTRYLVDFAQKLLMQPAESPKTRTQLFKPALFATPNLEAAARQRGVSTQSIFLAAYAKVHAANTSGTADEDVIIGVYLANRSLPINGIASAAVPTVNLLPLRVSKPLKRQMVEMAEDIQRDLQEISEPMNASASLFEISEWTGVKVDTFVNFLSLPDTPEAEGEAQNKDSITIEPTQQWEQSVSRVTEVEEHSLEPPAELVDERVNGAYLHAIDIEATIRNGALDVGVFAPTAMLSLHDGEELIKELRRQLETL
ncbi:NRPS [Alternaria arbusti]|uniref:NRPS n=1 Tax=Alternaria arbusti TaxID=232088 RepID=UPI00221F771C|nr:NRPS [Alternaria arbusti]KAI4959789.1 NRPS [Alternaria arbusti]